MTTTKRRGPTTRELLGALAAGATAVRPVFGAHWATCRHEPRTKYDPQPWTDGWMRYHAWELHADWASPQ